MARRSTTPLNDARRRPVRLLGIAALLFAPSLLLVGGCQPEERIVRWNPPLAGLPGARSQTPFTGRDGRMDADPTNIPPDQLRVDRGDGVIELRARSARHLMIHIYNTLRDNDADLFTDQVLSKVTADEFVQRGRNPREAFRILKRQERDILALFHMMPSGEQTPGVYWTRIGDVDGTRIYRLQVDGPGTADLRYTAMDIAMERGNFRLRWFGRPSRAQH